jgi:hypothetical protein
MGSMKKSAVCFLLVALQASAKTHLSCLTSLKVLLPDSSPSRRRRRRQQQLLSPFGWLFPFQKPALALIHLVLQLYPDSALSPAFFQVLVAGHLLVLEQPASAAEGGEGEVVAVLAHQAYP